MASDKEVPGLLDFLAGTGKELGRQLGQKAAALATDLASELKKGAPEPRPTGAEEGSKYDEMLKHLYRLTLDPQVLGDIINVFTYKNTEGKSVRMARISVGRRVIEAICPEGLTLTSGQSVRVHATSNQIIGLADVLPLGPTATVSEHLSDTEVAVMIANAARVVYAHDAKTLAHGDKVVLDEMQLVVIARLPKDALKFSLNREPANTLEDIVGQDDAVELLKEIVDFDPERDEVAKHYGRKPIKGVLVYGPPGCGKSMLGEGVAHRIAARYGKKGLSSGYIYVKGPEFLDMYVGESERAIRNAFEAAEVHKRLFGYRATFVLDECEALLSKRGSGKGADMEKTIVPTFLGLMNFTSAFVMLMTNRMDTLDPAVIRDKRTDRQIYIGRPTRAAAEIIIAKNLARFPFDQRGSSVSVLAHIATDAFYDPAKRLVDDGLTLRDGTAYFTLGNIVNGAMLTRFIEDAAGLAEKRDRKSGDLTGVSQEDILMALDGLYAEKRRLDHAAELEEFFIAMKDRMPEHSPRQAMRT